MHFVTKFKVIICASLVVLLSNACAPAGGSDENSQYNPESELSLTPPDADTDHANSDDMHDHVHDEVGSGDDDLVDMNCLRPNREQEDAVNLGLTLQEEFLARCASETGGSSWCAQLVRPNPRSSRTFACTYGSRQSAILIHPDKSTWKYPIEGVKILKELEQSGIQVSQIYNWWRPEPYNKNVGGAAGRHPYATSIDVRFASNSVAIKAFKELCKIRKAGRVRALGYYGSSSLHIGVGDKVGNTWGKSCN